MIRVRRLYSEVRMEKPPSTPFALNGLSWTLIKPKHFSSTYPGNIPTCQIEFQESQCVARATDKLYIDTQKRLANGWPHRLQEQCRANSGKVIFNQEILVRFLRIRRAGKPPHDCCCLRISSYYQQANLYGHSLLVVNGNS